MNNINDKLQSLMVYLHKPLLCKFDLLRARKKAPYYADDILKTHFRMWKSMYFLFILHSCFLHEFIKLYAIITLVNGLKPCSHEVIIWTSDCLDELIGDV